MGERNELAVLERRLRPIYDCIDVGNNKKAIQEADRVLKKHAGTTCAKVLKALAMIRMERMQEAWIVLDEAENMNKGIAMDDHTMQAFTHCFRETCTPERIVKLYDKQCSVQPTESNLAHLFMAHVRCRQYKQQQQVAMRLYKETNTLPYYFWAVMSLVMQGVENPVMGEKMFFPLAEKMIGKHVEDRGYGSGAQIELMAFVHEAMGNSELSAAILEGPDTNLLTSPRHFVTARVMRLLQKSGKHAETQTRARNLIPINVDDWTFWTILFDSTMELLKKEPKSEHKGILSIAVNVVREEYERCPSFRGPALARFELIKRLTEAGLQEYIEEYGLGGEGLLSLIVSYIKEFHTKPCCFEDVQPYIWILSQEDRQSLNEQLDKFVLTINRAEGDRAPENESWGLLVVERLKCVLRTKKPSREEARSHVQQLFMSMFRAADNDLSAAAFAQVAATIMWDLYVETDDFQVIYELMIIMEAVSLKHIPDPLSKLVLCRIYSHLGCTHRVQSMLKALDIKAVQRDSLGYIMHPLPELCGRFKIAIIHYTELGAMFDQSEREITECVVSAYKNGAFGQVPDLISLSKRMKDSALGSGSDVMNRWMSALFAVEGIEEIIPTLYGDEETIDWNSMIDNRDLSVLPILQSGMDASKEVDRMKEKSFMEMIDFFHVHDCLMKCAASIGRKEDSPAKVQSRMDSLEEIVRECKKKYSKEDKESLLLQSPTSYHLSGFLYGGYLDTMLTVLSSAVNCIVKEEKLIGEEELKKSIDVSLPLSTPLSSPFSAHPIIFQCSRSLQTLVFSKVVFLALLHRNGESSGSSSSSGKNEKGGKKKQSSKESSSSLSSTVSPLRSLIVSSSQKIESALNTVRDALQGDVLLPQIGDDWNKEVEQFLKKDKCSVDANIYKTYGAAIDDIQLTIETAFK